MSVASASPFDHAVASPNVRFAYALQATRYQSGTWVDADVRSMTVALRPDEALLLCKDASIWESWAHHDDGQGRRRLAV